MGFLPECPIDDGRDAERPQGVRCAVLHRTIGSWKGDYSVGKNRSHGSPGTFNELVGEGHTGDEWVQFYWPETRCTHAAGGNLAGPGIEFSGQNGAPLTDHQIRRGGRLIRLIHERFGIPLVFYDNPNGRVWLDKHGFSGFITHRSIDYPPNRSFNHYDFVTADEFQWMTGVSAPSPQPPQQEDEEMGTIVQAKGSDHWWFCRAGVRTHVLSQDEANELNFTGQSNNKKAGTVSKGFLSHYREQARS